MIRSIFETETISQVHIFLSVHFLYRAHFVGKKNSFFLIGLADIGQLKKYLPFERQLGTTGTRLCTEFVCLNSTCKRCVFQWQKKTHDSCRKPKRKIVDLRLRRKLTIFLHHITNVHLKSSSVRKFAKPKPFPYIKGK